MNIWLVTSVTAASSNDSLKFVIPNGRSARRNLLFCGRAMRDKRYYVYILASKSRVLYVGVTESLMGRTLQHKFREAGFTRRHNIDRLVYFETFRYVNNAIARETEIKAWRREKKVALIAANNPTWEDLAADWGKPVAMSTADSSGLGARSE